MKDKNSKPKKRGKLSNTFPILIYWLVIFTVLVILCTILEVVDLDLEKFAIITGSACFIYMGIEYGTDFFNNKRLPVGSKGRIPNLDRYRGLVYYWLVLLIVVLVLHKIKPNTSIPISQCTLIAGALSLEFIGGNKANKFAANSLEGDEEELPDDSSQVTEVDVVSSKK